MLSLKPFNLYLKHFLILSKTSEILQVIKLGGLPRMATQNIRTIVGYKNLILQTRNVQNVIKKAIHWKIRMRVHFFTDTAREIKIVYLAETFQQFLTLSMYLSNVFLAFYFDYVFRFSVTNRCR